MFEGSVIADKNGKPDAIVINSERPLRLILNKLIILVFSFFNEMYFQKLDIFNLEKII